jgi:hypothetical protein
MPPVNMVPTVINPAVTPFVNAHAVCRSTESAALTSVVDPHFGHEIGVFILF